MRLAQKWAEKRSDKRLRDADLGGWEKKLWIRDGIGSQMKTFNKSHSHRSQPPARRWFFRRPAVHGAVFVRGVVSRRPQAEKARVPQGADCGAGGGMSTRARRPAAVAHVCSAG